MKRGDYFSRRLDGGKKVSSEVFWVPGFWVIQLSLSFFPPRFAGKGKRTFPIGPIWHIQSRKKNRLFSGSADLRESQFKVRSFQSA